MPRKDLGELVEGYNLLTGLDERLKDPRDYNARADLGRYLYGKPQQFTEMGVDAVSADLNEAIKGSKGAKKHGLNKARKELTDYVNDHIDDVVKRLGDKELWNLAFSVNPKGKKDQYKKIEEYKQYAALKVLVEEKGSVQAMSKLLAGLYTDDFSAVYLSGGRDETVTRFYAEAREDIAKRIENKRKDIKEGEIRNYVRHGLKVLEDKDKAEVYPLVATMYHEKTKKKK